MSREAAKRAIDGLAGLPATMPEPELREAAVQALEADEIVRGSGPVWCPVPTRQRRRGSLDLSKGLYRGRWTCLREVLRKVCRIVIGPDPVARL